MRVTPEEAALAAGIAQALIARGEFGKGPFEGRVFPEGHESGAKVEWDPDAIQGLIVVATLALQIARNAIAVAENTVQSGDDGDEWKKGKPDA